MSADSANRSGGNCYRLTKESVKLGLVILEEAACMAVYETQDLRTQRGMEHITVQLKECSIGKLDSDDDEE